MPVLTKEHRDVVLGLAVTHFGMAPIGDQEQRNMNNHRLPPGSPVATAAHPSAPPTQREFMNSAAARGQSVQADPGNFAPARRVSRLPSLGIAKPPTEAESMLPPPPSLFERVTGMRSFESIPSEVFLKLQELVESGTTDPAAALAAIREYAVICVNNACAVTDPHDISYHFTEAAHWAHAFTVVTTLWNEEDGNPEWMLS